MHSVSLPATADVTRRVVRGHHAWGTPRALASAAAVVLSLFEMHLDAIVAALDEADYVEIGPGSMVVHRRREGGPTG